MNELKVFNNEQFGQIRMVEYNGQPYAVGVDVAKALEYSNPSKAIIQHCKGITKLGIPSSGGTQETNIIPEGDIFRLIIKAADQTKNEEIQKKAQAFESWIFDEILPTIRKTGGYVANDDMFVDTYLPFADDTTKTLFRSTLEVVKKQNLYILQQQKEIKHKEDVIIGLVDEVSLAEKRQILNRVVRKTKNYQDRWNELYKNFEMKYHINLGSRLESYNESHKPKLRNKLDYIDKEMNKIPELYEIACKLYENDVKALVNEMYRLNNAV